MKYTHFDTFKTEKGIGTYPREQHLYMVLKIIFPDIIKPLLQENV